TTSAPAVDYKACMVSDSGGFDDKSFNQAGYEGLMAVADDLGLETATAASADIADFEGNINSLIADGCNLVITVGVLHPDATAAAAVALPDVAFAIPECACAPPLDHVKTIVFATDEAAFLAG